jgi:malate synthase
LLLLSGRLELDDLAHVEDRATLRISAAIVAAVW